MAKSGRIGDSGGMPKPNPQPRDPSADPVYLAAAVVTSLIQPLPCGTAYFIGVVLITMMRGRLVQCKGSLARAVLPLVVHLRWGWHRVERAMERGQLSLDTLFDRAKTHANIMSFGPAPASPEVQRTKQLTWRSSGDFGIASGLRNRARYTKG